MKNIRPNAPDISHFEKKFREMVYEVQRSNNELENLEKERLSISEELYTKNSLLQSERKTLNELRIRLKLASETINLLEEEKMRDKIDYINLSTNYEALLKEREVLKGEALSYQTEAAKFKFKIESLQSTLQKEIRQREKLEEALAELKSENEKTIVNIDTNMAKITKEQKYLLESAKAVISLNRRLQTFGLCSYAINERNKAEIKKLQHKLIAVSANETSNSDQLHPEIENLCFKLKEILTELKSKTQDCASFEEKMNKIFDELSTQI